MAQRKNSVDRIKWSHGTEQEENQSISEGLKPEVQLNGGVYRTTLPTYSDGDNTILHTSSDGRIKIDSTDNGLYFYAEETVPTEASDGDLVKAWADTFGRQIIAGYNSTADVIDVQESAPALLLISEFTNLDAVTSTGAGSSIDASSYNKITVQYIASSVTDGGTVKLQGSLDNSNWYDIDEEDISEDGSTYYSVSGEKHKYIRTNLSSRTDGTYTTEVYLGN
ncbi:MAG: hypothetical protein ACOC5T_06585 [Elusimicrobiota bacterium]